MTEKKLTPLERKSVERNAAAVKRDIQINTERIKVLKKMKDVRLKHYYLTREFKANMAYQEEPEFLALSKKLDELKWDEEILKLEAFVEEREDTYEEYNKMLKERG